MTETEFEQILNKYFIIYAVIGTLIMISSFFQVRKYLPPAPTHFVKDTFQTLKILLSLCFFNLQTMFWEYVSEHQVHTIRKIYFAQILHQEINWYDENDEGNLPNKLAE